MSANQRTDPGAGLPPVFSVATIVTIAALGALVGVYWDIATHIDLGRDSFWAPAHIAIIASLTFGVVGALISSAIRERRISRASGVHLQAPLFRLPVLGTEITTGSLLSIVAVVVVSLSFPIDEFWHRVFGLDVSLWSPPHVILIVAGFTAAWGLVIQLVDELNRMHPARLHPGFRPLRDADLGTWLFLLGTGAFTAGLLLLTAEYDFDVPQFNLIWHPPVLIGISAFMLALARRACDRRFAATVVAAFVTGARLLAVAVLVGLGRSTPHIPLLVIPALTVDLLDRSGARRRHPSVTGIAYALTAVLTESIWMRVSGGLVWPRYELMLGGAIGLLVGATCWYLGDRAGMALRPVSLEAKATRVTPARVVATGLILAVVLAPSAALAHSEDAETVELVLSEPVVAGRPFDVVVHLPADASPTLIEFGRAQHRISQPLIPEATAGDFVAGNFILPSGGRWSVLIRYRLSGGGYLSDAELSVPTDEKRLLLYSQSDRRGSLPSWVQIVAWLVVLLMTTVMGVLLAMSFRAVRRGALEAQANA